MSKICLSQPSAKISLTLCTLNALLPKEVQSNYLNNLWTKGTIKVLANSREVLDKDKDHF